MRTAAREGRASALATIDATTHQAASFPLIPRSTVSGKVCCVTVAITIIGPPVR
jgi:hypothetical protein